MDHGFCNVLITASRIHFSRFFPKSFLGIRNCL